MADQSIDIVVSERGVSQAAERVIILADGMDRAEQSVGRLRQQLDGLRSDGLVGMISSLNGASSSIQTLRSNTEGLASAQRTSESASRASAEARQYESTVIKGLVGTKQQLREIERTLAQEERSAAAEAKAALAEESTARKRVIADILGEREVMDALQAARAKEMLAAQQAADSLQAARTKQMLETERQIALEMELGRARELADLKSDIIQRNPPIQPVKPPSDKDIAATESAAAQAALQAENSAVIAQYERMAQMESVETGVRAELAESTLTLSEAYAQLEAQGLTTIETMNGLSAAEQGEIETIDMLSAAYAQMAEATLAVSQAKTLMREVQSATKQGWFDETEACNATSYALQQQAEATQMLAGAKGNLAEVQAYLNASTEVDVQFEHEASAAIKERVASLNTFIASEKIGTAATEGFAAAGRGLVSANVSGAASLGLLEGRTMSMTRAASNFLTKILPLGSILQAAFPVIGAIALISVLTMGYDAAKKFIDEAVAAPSHIEEAYRAISVSEREANDGLQATLDKLKQADDKLLKKYDAKTGMQVLLDDLIKQCDDLGKQLDEDLKKFQQLAKEKENNIGATAGYFTRQEPTAPTYDQVGGILAEIARKQETANDTISSLKRSIDTATPQSAAEHGFSNVNDFIAAQKASLEYTKQHAETDIAAFRAQSLTVLQIALSTAQSKQHEYEASIEGVKNNNHPGDVFINSALDSSRDQQAVMTILRNGMKTLDSQTDNTRIRTETAAEQARHQGIEEHKIGSTGAGKEDAKNWREALTAYKLYVGEIAKDTGHNATVAQSQAWWEQEMSKLRPANKDRGQAEIDKYIEQGNTQQEYIAESTNKLRDKIAGLSTYGDELKETTELEKFMADAQRRGIVLTQDQIATYTALSRAYQEDPRRSLQKEINTIMREAVVPQKEYNNEMTAGAMLIQKYPQYAAQIQAVLDKITEKWRNAIDPMRQFNQGIKDQETALEYFGTAERVESQILAMQRQRTAEGHAMSQQEIQDAKDKLTALEHQKELHDDLARIYGNEADKLSALRTNQLALDQAYNSGKIDPDQYKFGAVQNQAAINQTQDDTSGDGKDNHYVTNMLAQYVKIKDVGAGIQQSLNQTFDALADGVANSIGKAIVEGKSLWDGLKSAGRQALEMLLTDIIKIGIQLLIVNTLMKAFHLQMPQQKDPMADAAKSIAAIATVTIAQMAAFHILQEPAWSLAEAVSLASFGANAIAAEAGIAAVKSAGMAAQHFAEGGLVRGDLAAGTDTVPAWLTPNEYVLTANTVSRMGGPAALDQIQKGASPYAVQMGTSATGQSGQTKVEVHNYNGSRVEVQQVTPDHVRMIVRDEAPGLIAQHAPGVIANDISNPNGSTSKALRNNVTSTRIR